ncbi:DNA polymerase Y family protein [Neorhizobium sp. JUb45]|uniref:Y-family DNA polymerase n=1 Tax=unclassified Neorhizobium TaxID=2629175 RepID=UPI00247A9B2C|nr:DNA polymerase Y family protein [Neorhizobium sp. JUb45]
MRTGQQRILALTFPRLSIDRVLRRQWGHGWRSSGRPETGPVVCVAFADNTLRLVGCDEEAGRLGLRLGQGLAEARAICPNVIVIDEDQAADHRLLEGIADWCDRYTPLVALEGRNGLFLDITGCAHLMGGEAALLEDILNRLSQMGLEVRGAISSSPGLSWAVCHYGDNRVVRDENREEALAPLPVAALRLGPNTVAALQKLGLKRVADLMRTPRAPLVRRFGAEVMLRLDQACGDDEEPISPRRPVASLSAERRLADPIKSEDDILFVTRQIAQCLLSGFEARGAGGRLFELVLFRIDGQVSRISAGASRPLRDADRITALFTERLASLQSHLDIGFGYEILRLNVLHHEPFESVQSDLAATDRRHLSLSTFVDQVAARLGPDCLQTYQLRESHIPERAEIFVPAIEALPLGKQMPETPAVLSRSERPLRLFRVPEPLESFAAEIPDGPPTRFRWRRLTHQVARAEGPERLSPEWWLDDEEAATRDYFRLESTAGYRFWIFRKGLYDRDPTQRWFMHGLFA